LQKQSPFFLSVFRGKPLVKISETQSFIHRTDYQKVSGRRAGAVLLQMGDCDILPGLQMDINCAVQVQEV